MVGLPDHGGLRSQTLQPIDALPHKRRSQRRHVWHVECSVLRCRRSGIAHPRRPLTAITILTSLGGFMKRATMMLTVVVLLGALATLNAQVSVVPSQMVIGFTGGSTWTSYTTGTCVWYFPVLGNLDLKSLFMTDPSVDPTVEKKNILTSSGCLTGASSRRLAIQASPNPHSLECPMCRSRWR